MADKDRGNPLELALAQIEKQFGKGAIMRLGDNDVQKVEAVSTGCLTLDIALGIGGTLVSNHPEWTARAKHLSTQAKTDLLQFKHDEVGYNYRMTNIDACLGLAQMELLEGFIEHKTARYEQYKAALDGVKGFSMLPFREGTRSNHWFYSLLLPVVMILLPLKL